MSTTEITRTETRERAALISVQDYEIELDVSRESETFRSTTTIHFTCAAPGASTYVDLLAEPSGVEAITLNGVALAPAAHYTFGRITLPGLDSSNTLTVVASLEYSTPGFHRSTDPEDGKVYTYTKFEPDHARRVFACFEQPDLKAPFAISVIAPAFWTVISTQPTPSPSPLPRPLPSDPELARWSFDPTPPLSTYLMHVTAGEYRMVRSSHTTARGQTIPLGLACRASAESSLATDAEELFDLTRRGLDHFTALFDMDYPFAKYDHQFVPDFPAGATEHPAAVTIDDNRLFRSRQTDAAYEQRATILLHEMAHMWFGDLVTMEWWDDLWLNESFAEWAGHQAAASATRFTGAWTTFATQREVWGYATDLSPGTHPISAQVETVSSAMANFDGISYAKGAAVLRQLIVFLGEDAFVAGLRAYFAEHAWGNTTVSDFLRHLSDASGTDLDAWSEAWLRTARPNTLAASFAVNSAGEYTSFDVVQSASVDYPTLRPHHIAIGLYQRSDGRLVRVHRVEVDVAAAPSTPVPELAGHRQPDLLLLNDDDLGYALIRFDPDSQATLDAAVGEFADSLARAVCLTSAAMLTAQGEAPLPDYVRLAAAAMASEPSVPIMQSIRDSASSTMRLLASPAWLPQGMEILAATAHQGLYAADSGSDLQLAWAYVLAENAAGENQLELVRGLYQGTVELPGLEVSPDLRWSLLVRLTAAGLAGDAEIDTDLAADPSSRGEQAARAARAGIPDAAHKEAAWALLTGTQELNAQTINLVGKAFRQTADPRLLAPFRDRYFEVLPELWERRKSFAKQASATILFPMSEIDDRLFEQIDLLLEQHKEPDAALVRVMLDLRESAKHARASRALSARTAGRSSGSGPGTITPDGCSVELYAQLESRGEPQIVHGAVPAGASILELGCGTGRISTPLARMGHRVVGVDESAEMLAQCTGIETVQSSIQGLDLTERFDVVLLPSHLINSPNEQERSALLQTCRRHLAPGGVVIVQRHRPGWVREATDVENDDGQMLSSLTVLDRPAPDLLRAKVRYEVGDHVWEQEFTALDVDDAVLPEVLAAGGLVLERLLTEDGGWVLATAA